jgi:hypothetical protein
MKNMLTYTMRKVIDRGRNKLYQNEARSAMPNGINHIKTLGKYVTNGNGTFQYLAI